MGTSHPNSRTFKCVKTGDRVDINIEAAKGHLFNLQYECNEHKNESRRLYLQVLEMGTKMIETACRLSDAISKVQFYISDH